VARIKNVKKRLLHLQGSPKNSKLLNFSISSLNIDQFLQFFTKRVCKKFVTQWHAHHIYYVATLPCKTQEFKN